MSLSICANDAGGSSGNYYVYVRWQNSQNAFIERMLVSVPWTGEEYSPSIQLVDPLLHSRRWDDARTWETATDFWLLLPYHVNRVRLNFALQAWSSVAIPADMAIDT